MKFKGKEIKSLYVKFKHKETDRNRQEQTGTDRNRQEQTGTNKIRHDQKETDRNSRNRQI